MNDPIDIDTKRSKIKLFWRKYQDEIVYFATMALIAGVSVGLMAYVFKSYKQLYGAVKTPVVNEGVKSLYQLGGPDSPLTYELTDAVAAAYNRAGQAIANAKKTFGGYRINAEPYDMSAWNYVAQMTNDYLKTHGPVASDLVKDHFLTKIS